MWVLGFGFYDLAQNESSIASFLLAGAALAIAAPFVLKLVPIPPALLQTAGPEHRAARPNRHPVAGSARGRALQSRAGSRGSAAPCHRRGSRGGGQALLPPPWNRLARECSRRRDRLEAGPDCFRRIDDHATADQNFRAPSAHLPGEIHRKHHSPAPRANLVEGPDPRRVSQPARLRQPEYRARGGGGLLLRQTGLRFERRRGGFPGRACRRIHES